MTPFGCEQELCGQPLRPKLNSWPHPLLVTCLGQVTSWLEGRQLRFYPGSTGHPALPCSAMASVITPRLCSCLLHRPDSSHVCLSWLSFFVGGWCFLACCSAGQVLTLVSLFCKAGDGGAPGVPEQTAWPGPEQTPVIVLQALFQRSWGGEGTSNVTCQGVNLEIWTSVTWHMGDIHRGFRSEEELPLSTAPRG